MAVWRSDIRDEELDAQIRFVLAHPGLSDWLKTALSGALEQDAVSALNEAAILKALLRRRMDRDIARWNYANPGPDQRFQGDDGA